MGDVHREPTTTMATPKEKEVRQTLLLSAMEDVSKSEAKMRKTVQSAQSGATPTSHQAQDDEWIIIED